MDLLMEFSLNALNLEANNVPHLAGQALLAAGSPADAQCDPEGDRL
jgi:hypothetical protein